MIDDHISFTETEQLTCQGARLMERGRSYFIAAGGPPSLAVVLGKRLYAPDLVYALGDGTIDPQPDFPPRKESTPYTRATAWADLNTVRFHATAGYMDYAVLEAIQVDQYGNFNTSMRGTDYQRPRRRFGGAGGANELASCCWRTILVMDLEKRRFVPKVDFITSPGYLDGSPGARERAGLPADTGPWRVVTDDALFGYDEESHRMEVLAVGQWTSLERVLQKMSFEPLVAKDLKVLEPPSLLELWCLRTEIDPERVQLAGLESDFVAPQGGWIRPGGQAGVMDEAAYVDMPASYQELLERRAREKKGT